MKIVILDAQTVSRGDVDLEIYRQYGDLEIYQLTTPELTAERIKDADIAVCNKAVIGENEMKNAKNLKFITVFATGYNNIDVDYAAKRGIIVSNAGTYSTDAVAQHVFALMLEHFSRVGDYSHFVDEGGWLESPSFSPFVFPADEIAGKTLGIFGLGSIGKAVADIALAFKMRVIACSRSKKNYREVTDVDFETLLRESDVLTLHCPLTPETRYTFDKSVFDRCKDGAYFINTARGAVTVESDLADAVRSGKLSGAGIDVLDGEPMKPGCPLLGVPGITITPHVAWGPLTTRIRLIGIIRDNIEAFLAGKPINRVN